MQPGGVPGAVGTDPVQTDIGQVTCKCGRMAPGDPGVRAGQVGQLYHASSQEQTHDAGDVMVMQVGTEGHPGKLCGSEGG